MPPCSRCGATITWHKTKAGKSMPLDPGAHPDGNCFIDPADNRVVVLGKDDPRRSDGSVVLLRPHWASCPSTARR